MSNDDCITQPDLAVAQYLASRYANGQEDFEDGMQAGQLALLEMEQGIKWDGDDYALDKNSFVPEQKNALALKTWRVRSAIGSLTRNEARLGTLQATDAVREDANGEWKPTITLSNPTAEEVMAAFHAGSTDNNVAGAYGPPVDCRKCWEALMRSHDGHLYCASCDPHVSMHVIPQPQVLKPDEIHDVPTRAAMAGEMFTLVSDDQDLPGAWDERPREMPWDVPQKPIPPLRSSRVKHSTYYIEDVRVDIRDDYQVFTAFPYVSDPLHCSTDRPALPEDLPDEREPEEMVYDYEFEPDPLEWLDDSFGLPSANNLQADITTWLQDSARTKFERVYTNAILQGYGRDASAAVAFRACRRIKPGPVYIQAVQFDGVVTKTGAIIGYAKAKNMWDFLGITPSQLESVRAVDNRDAQTLASRITQIRLRE